MKLKETTRKWIKWQNKYKNKDRINSNWIKSTRQQHHNIKCRNKAQDYTFIN